MAYLGVGAQENGGANQILLDGVDISTLPIGQLTSGSNLEYVWEGGSVFFEAISCFWVRSCSAIRHRRA
jgi:hypothetical protein